MLVTVGGVGNCGGDVVGCGGGGGCVGGDVSDNIDGVGGVGGGGGGGGGSSVVGCGAGVGGGGDDDGVGGDVSDNVGGVGGCGGPFIEANWRHDTSICLLINIILTFALLLIVGPIISIILTRKLHKVMKKEIIG
jgi:hypothetical protein